MLAHAVEQLEDRRVGADPERQREHGHTCESGRSPKQTEAEAQVLSQGVDDAAGVHLADLLATLDDVAERGVRRNVTDP
jgi:hypothetical protein